MAFTDAEIESAGSDAWTGKSTSLVYETTSTVATRLSRRGKTAFSTASADDQETALLQATEEAEDSIRSRFRGIPVNNDQRLLFPAYGAYDGRGRLLTENTAPHEYLEGIGLLAEEVAAGTFMTIAGAAGGVGIISERTRNSSTTYRQGLDLSSISTNHPGAWRKLRMALPRTF